MSFKEYDIQKFTEALSSKDPEPGGGGASALVAAVGISLGNMVGSLTIGKKKYAAVETEMLIWMKKAQDLRLSLLELIDADADAFLPLSEVYKMPKDDPERAERMEKALEGAAAVPMQLLELCCEVLDLMERFAENGSVLAISDAATGAVVCKAALQGAWINLKVNTSAMKDREKAELLEKEAQDRKEIYEIKADAIYKSVMERIG